MSAAIATLPAATCAECGKAFEYRRRGNPQLTCSDDCRQTRRQRLMVERLGRWALRRTPVGALGFPMRLACRSVTSDGFGRPEPDNAAPGEPCDEDARVLYAAADGTAYLLCDDHDTDAAAKAAASMGLRHVELPFGASGS